MKVSSLGQRPRSIGNSAPRCDSIIAALVFSTELALLGGALAADFTDPLVLWIVWPRVIAVRARPQESLPALRALVALGAEVDGHMRVEAISAGQSLAAS